MKMKRFIRLTKSYFFWFVVLLVGLVFLCDAIKYQIMLTDLDNDNVAEYCGSYTVFVKRTAPNNKVYIVELGNGDTLSINTIFIENDDQFENNDVADFKYSRQRFVSILGLHSEGISITSIDGTFVYLDENEATAEAKSGTIIYYFLSILIISFALLPVWTAMGLQILLKSNKSKRKRRKKEIAG
ncbi:MAG: hypothetical protein J6K64_05240 [Clostridia bacterium]|nr:hypothetical protein [Clostridia bacterium]